MATDPKVDGHFFYQGLQRVGLWWELTEEQRDAVPLENVRLRSQVLVRQPRQRPRRELLCLSRAEQGQQLCYALLFENLFLRGGVERA